MDMTTTGNKVINFLQKKEKKNKDLTTHTIDRNLKQTSSLEHMPDLTHKLSQIHKENTAPNQVEKIQKTNTRSILNTNNQKRSHSRNSLHSNDTIATTNDVNRKRLSMSDVSDMLYEFYRANAAAKAPKSQAQQQPLPIMGTGATAAAVKYVGQTSPTSAETHEPSSIAAIATYGAASETASKNLQSDEMMSTQSLGSFHPRIKVPNKLCTIEAKNEYSMPAKTAIPTSVVVSSTSTAAAEPLDIKPIINPNTGLVITPIPSVIKPITDSTSNPQAAAIAAALLRDGYHSFQQQMRAQELIKFHTGKMAKSTKVEDSSATTKILETFLRQQRHSECDNDSASDYNDGDDEDDSRYNGFDDIHLMEGPRGHLPQLLQNAMANNSQTTTPSASDYTCEESQKYMSLAAQAHALRNLEYTLGEFGNTSPNDSLNMGPTGIGADGEPVYECRHCGKKYRWKSTLRRHENVECGGKEPSHACPYCPYKSKQRGNLGVHVRKHHSNLPQLASKRRSKYSMKFESNPSSANVSDDSNSKLIIDCSK